MKKAFFISLLLFCFNQTILAEHFLSFIIPCYNCEPWIEKTIDSIYAQKNLKCPFEIVCTDDASTDATLPILLALSEKHPEITVFRHGKNKGGGAARNKCVKQSRGDIIFCLDADNILEPNSVQLLIDQMDTDKSDIVCFGMVNYFKGNFESNGQLVYYTPTRQYELKNVLENPNSPPWSGNYLYTRKSYNLAGGYPEVYGAVDTFSFGFLQLKKNCKMTYVPNTFYWHRQGIESYYIRDHGSKALHINFMNFILSQKELFTDKSIAIVQAQLDAIAHNQNFYDHCILTNKKLLVLKTK